MFHQVIQQQQTYLFHSPYSRTTQESNHQIQSRNKAITPHRRSYQSLIFIYIFLA